MMAALGRATSRVDYVRRLERRHEHVRRLARLPRRLRPAADADRSRRRRRGSAQFDTAARRCSSPRSALLRARAGGLLRRPAIVDKMIDDNLGWVPYTQLANLTGRRP